MGLRGQGYLDAGRHNEVGTVVGFIGCSTCSRRNQQRSCFRVFWGYFRVFLRSATWGILTAITGAREDMLLSRIMVLY